MRQEELRELASFYGYDFVDISDRYPYNQRKGKTYGLYCRRYLHLEVAYASTTQIKDYLKKLGTKKLEKP